MDTLEWAQFWQKLGVAVIPIRYRDKRPLVRAWAEYRERLPSDTELLRWFSPPRVNLAVVTGWNNLTVIDFDDLERYKKWQLWLARQPIYRWVRDTLQVKTARGVHVYLYLAHKQSGVKLPGIDIKAAGGYVLAPPSIHPSGARYEVMAGRLPVRVEQLSDVLPIRGTPIPPVRRAPAYPIEQFLPPLVKVRGRWGMTHCPFHDDKKPSMWVDLERQLCGCFAGCTPRPYNAVDVYARLYNVSWPEALEKVKGIATVRKDKEC